jgi:hypothetical protein
MEGQVLKDHTRQFSRNRNHLSVSDSSTYLIKGEMITLIFFPKAGPEMALPFFLARNSLHGMMQPVPQSFLPERVIFEFDLTMQYFNCKSK